MLQLQLQLQQFRLSILLMLQLPQYRLNILMLMLQLMLQQFRLRILLMLQLQLQQLRLIMIAPCPPLLLGVLPPPVCLTTAVVLSTPAGQSGWLMWTVQATLSAVLTAALTSVSARPGQLPGRPWWCQTSSSTLPRGGNRSR